MHPLRPRRTILLAALVAVALTAVGCSGGSEGAAPTTEAPTTTTTLPPTTTTTLTPTPARKVLILGDSGMVDASPAVTAMFEATGAEVVMAAAPGYGLTRLGTIRDSSAFRTDYSRLLRENDPDLVVIMLGLWDTAYIEQNGVLAYTRVVKEAADILVSQGAKVLWLAVSPGGKSGDRPQNLAFEVAAAMLPGQVFYADFEGSLRGPDGGYPVSYVAVDGSTVHLRKADGWHFCPDGAERVAADVNRLAVIHGLTVPAAGGWQNGRWRSSPLYDEPACTA